MEIPVNVQLNPLNEHTPAFGTDLDVSFAETSAIGTTIATHVASDTDFSPHDVQEYQISSGRYQLQFYLFEDIAQ